MRFACNDASCECSIHHPSSLSSQEYVENKEGPSVKAEQKLVKINVYFTRNKEARNKIKIITFFYIIFLSPRHIQKFLLLFFFIYIFNHKNEFRDAHSTFVYV